MSYFLQHVLGSSSLRNLEDTLTQITFHVDRLSFNPQLSDERSFTIEFNSTELKNFISLLKRACES